MEFLDFFIASAHAQDAAPTGGLMSFLPLIIIFVIFYFLLIRPQMKRAKEHKNLVAALGTGDEVVTNGGIVGKITDVDENFLTCKIAENVEVKVQRHAVASVLPKGTVKKL